MSDVLPVLEAKNLYHVYESRAEDGNVVQRVGCTSPSSRVRPWPSSARPALGNRRS